MSRFVVNDSSKGSNDTLGSLLNTDISVFTKEKLKLLTTSFWLQTNHWLKGKNPDHKTHFTGIQGPFTVPNH